MAEILLDNILRLFSTEIFGKDKSAYYVGGEKKLISLIEAGKVKVISLQMFRMVNGIVMLLKYCCIVGVQRKSNVKNGKNENIENRS